MRVGKRPVETIKDGNEDCDRTGRNEIGKIGGNGHDTLLGWIARGVVLVRGGRIPSCFFNVPCWIFLLEIRRYPDLHRRRAFQPWLDVTGWKAVVHLPRAITWSAEPRARFFHGRLNL